MKYGPKGLPDMTILVDTNVALDVLLNRQPWYTAAAVIFNLTKQGIITAYLSATTVTDIFYLAKKDLGKSAARAAILRLLGVFPPRNRYRRPYLSCSATRMG
jgi:hypothetical protein